MICKRKQRFSFSQLESEFVSSNESRRVIDDVKSKLSSVDWTCASSDEFLAIMTLYFSASCTSDLTSVATVVTVTCGPWREGIAVELLGLLTPSQLDSIDSAVCATLQRALLDPRASYESVFAQVLERGTTLLVAAWRLQWLCAAAAMAHCTRATSPSWQPTSQCPVPSR